MDNDGLKFFLLVIFLVFATFFVFTLGTFYEKVHECELLPKHRTSEKYTEEYCTTWEKMKELDR